MLLIKILILITLAGVFLQDLSSRSVYWWMFPILTVLFFAYGLVSGGFFLVLWPPIMLNCSFLTIQLLLVSYYFSFKQRRWINITDSLLGWGDILFLLATAFYFSVLNFLFFYVISLLAVLGFWVFRIVVFKKENSTIPLAGIQSVMLAALLVGDWWYFHINVTNDNWLLHYIIK